MSGARLPGTPVRKRVVSRGFCQTWDDDRRAHCKTDVELDGVQSWTYCPRCFNKVRLIPDYGKTVKGRRPPGKQA